MSGSASHAHNRVPRPALGEGLRRLGWRALVVAITPALLCAGAGCNQPIKFTDPPGMSIGGDAGVDTTPPAPDLGGADVPMGMDAPVDTGTDAPVDAPLDIAVDNGPDVPADVQRDVQPDVQPDRGPDVQPDVRPDVRPDTGVDANGPLVCGNDTDCHFPTLPLHCLIASGQSGGSCVECAGDADCGARRCDTMAGSQTLHRCVECMSAADCPTTSPGDHLSTCNPEHRCLNGCSDDTPAQLICPKAGFVCQTSGGSQPDHQCADCLQQQDCALPFRFCNDFVCVQCQIPSDCATGSLCDLVSGLCVQCRDSADCHAPGMRLCNPANHLCGPG